MANSMTGFGRAELNHDDWRVSCELRSVNHRYLDLSIRLPYGYQAAEPEVRRLVQEHLKRGHVDITVTLADERESRMSLSVDQGLAGAYREAAQEMSQGRTIDEGELAMWILEQRDVVQLTPAALDQEAVSRSIQSALSEALEQLSDMREEEGVRLVDDIRMRLRQLQQLRGEVAESAASQPSELRERLETRLNELLAQSSEDVALDPARLAQEAAILADKADVTEELLRLASHLQQLNELLAAESSEGRRMDFVLQEVNREINTIQSKSRDQTIDRLSIDMKALTEQIREQVQNIE